MSMEDINRGSERIKNWQKGIKWHIKSTYKTGSFNCIRTNTYSALFTMNFTIVILNKDLTAMRTLPP